jgi:DNA-3-methyladenine glycosylase II
MLDYAPPLDWSFFLHYFSTRSTPGVESVTEERYIRSIIVEGQAGILIVQNDATKCRLIVTVRGDAAGHAKAAEQRLRRMFDLDADMNSIHGVLRKDRKLARLITTSPGIRVPGTWSAFEVIARAIVGQQVSVKAASTIIGRIADRLGTPIEGTGSIRRQFPTPYQIAIGDLSNIGMPGKRTQALQSVAAAIAHAQIPFCDLGRLVEGVKEALLKQRGIGPWTAEYFALRALRDADAWPGTDLVLKRAVIPDSAVRTSPAELENRSSRWRPWRAYAAMHLWRNAHNESLQSREPK